MIIDVLYVFISFFVWKRFIAPATNIWTAGVAPQCITSLILSFIFVMNFFLVTIEIRVIWIWSVALFILYANVLMDQLMLFTLSNAVEGPTAEFTVNHFGTASVCYWLLLYIWLIRGGVNSTLVYVELIDQLWSIFSFWFIVLNFGSGFSLND